MVTTLIVIHIAQYAFQIVTLYTLNACNVICQLYVNKAGVWVTGKGGAQLAGPPRHSFHFTGTSPSWVFFHSSQPTRRWSGIHRPIVPPNHSLPSSLGTSLTSLTSILLAPPRAIYWLFHHLCPFSTKISHGNHRRQNELSRSSLHPLKDGK